MTELSKTKRKELKRQERDAERERTMRRRTLKRSLRWGSIALALLAVLAGIGGGAWYVSSRPPIVEAEVVSRSGLHRHSNLRIFIKGKVRDIPANVGIGAVHRPVHTHDPDGVIHLEFDGLVTLDDLRLREFFASWGERFDRNCIFEYCNGPDGTVKMFVNGEENQEFERYVMRDGDKIEITYR